jgi:hypothetical protein
MMRLQACHLLLLPLLVYVMQQSQSLRQGGMLLLVVEGMRQS